MILYITKKRRIKVRKLLIRPIQLFHYNTLNCFSVALNKFKKVNACLVFAHIDIIMMSIFTNKLACYTINAHIVVFAIYSQDMLNPSKSFE